MAFSEYLNALSLEAPQQANLAFLEALTERHIERFTFNNLAVLLHENLLLDRQTLLDKIVTRDIGGYCFEHNKLAYEALSEWGFNVRLVLARVINNNERPVPRTHRITLVNIEGRVYLMDVGFGATCPIKPLLLDHSDPQTAGFESFQITRNDQEEYELWQLRSDGPFLLYRFDLACYTDADCEMGHFYSHKHPDAVFVNNLVVSKKTHSEGCAITNQWFRHRAASLEESKLIDSASTLSDLLTDVFKLNIEQEVCDFLFAHHIAPTLESTNVR